MIYKSFVTQLLFLSIFFGKNFYIQKEKIVRMDGQKPNFREVASILQAKIDVVSLLIGARPHIRHPNQRLTFFDRRSPLLKMATTFSFCETL